MRLPKYSRSTHAKTCGSFRHLSGMCPRALLPLLIALCATATCFTPEYHCRILCGANNSCPSGFACDVDSKLCASNSSGGRCPVADAGVDAGTPEPDAPVADLAPTENPAEVCYGSGACFQLSPEMRQSLVLWLDPGTLPPSDSPVARWPDRSREANDAVAISGQSPPRSRGDGIELSRQAGGSLWIQDDPSLDFGALDFSVLIVARVESGPPSCFFSKVTPDRNDPKGIRMGWSYSMELGRVAYLANVNASGLLSPSTGVADLAPHVFVLNRSNESATARIDGAITAVGALTPSVSVSVPEPVFLGSCRSADQTIPVLHAAIAFRGPIPTTDLVRLEAFLRQSFP